MACDVEMISGKTTSTRKPPRAFLVETGRRARTLRLISYCMHGMNLPGERLSSATNCLHTARTNVQARLELGQWQGTFNGTAKPVRGSGHRAKNVAFCEEAPKPLGQIRQDRHQVVSIVRSNCIAPSSIRFDVLKKTFSLLRLQQTDHPGAHGALPASGSLSVSAPGLPVEGLHSLTQAVKPHSLRLPEWPGPVPQACTVPLLSVNRRAVAGRLGSRP
jgi:hypothetical protein